MTALVGRVQTSSGVLERRRTSFVYVLMVLVGIGAFLYPFWLPADALPDEAHAGDAPLVAAVVGALVVAAVTLEVRRGTMNGATVAVLGVVSALCALLRLLDLPGGGNAMFFLVVIAAAALGPRFGLLLGLCAMATSSILTGGIGPWLPFQMLALSWMAAGAGALGRPIRRLPPLVQVGVLAAYGWAWGFLYGAIMNVWFWPFAIGDGDLAWHPGLTVAETFQRYWSFYVVTSFGWDAAGAFVNAVLIVLLGIPLLRAFRRVAGRIEPVVVLESRSRRPDGSSRP
jgi:energy-coupling factor transport system substrate-specific component